MQKYYIILTFLLSLIYQISLAQQMPIDFSDAAEDFSVWGGSEFSTRTSPTDANNTVGEFFHNNTATEQGFYIDLVRPIDLDFQKNITLSFYAFDSNVHTVGLKLESGINPNVQVNVNTISSQNNWQLLTFDFTTVNGVGKYDRLTILIDNGNAVPGTYLMDDIDDGSTPTNPNVIDVEYTQLVWFDEFDTSGTGNPVNSNNWYLQTQLPSGGSWYNNEVQHYTNRIDNSKVENGFLKIIARKESFTDQGITKQYTSARLNSKFAFTYGRVDVRAKLPIQSGTWPAIWMLGKNINEDGGYWDNQGFDTTNWPACGEIDIMEHGIFPNEGINFINSALHTPCCYGGNPNGGGTYATDLENEYHLYSVNWSPNQMTFLLDGVGFYTYKPAVKDASTWPFDKDQYILLNIAMGGNAGVIDSSIDGSINGVATMEIDYVRVYQASSLSNEDNAIADIKIFPNPSHATINITSKLIIDRVELYDMMGKQIFNKKKNTGVIEIKGLNPGLYILEIYSGTQKSIKKVVIN